MSDQATQEVEDTEATETAEEVETEDVQQEDLFEDQSKDGSESDIPETPDSIIKMYNERNTGKKEEEEEISQEGDEKDQETDSADTVGSDEQDSATQESKTAQTAYVPSQYELVKAHELGLTAEDVKLAGQNLGMYLLQAEKMRGQQDDQQQEEAEEVYKKITMPENEDMEETQKESLQSIVDQFNSQIDLMNEREKAFSEQATLSDNAAQEQQQKVFDQYWDQKIAELPEDIREIVGDANTIQEGTTQFDKHNELMTTFDALDAGFKNLGIRKSDDEIFELAKNSVFSNNIKQTARKEVEKKVVKRGEQTIERPTARSSKKIDENSVKGEESEINSAFQRVMDMWDEKHPDRPADREHFLNT